MTYIYRLSTDFFSFREPKRGIGTRAEPHPAASALREGRSKKSSAVLVFACSSHSTRPYISAHREVGADGMPCALPFSQRLHTMAPGRRPEAPAPPRESARRMPAPSGLPSLWLGGNGA